MSAGDFERRPSPFVDLPSELTTKSSFQSVSVRCVGGTWHFVGIGTNGEPLVERVSPDGAGGWTHEVHSPPDRMEDWPTCVCGHERFDHDMWGSADCGGAQCGCTAYRYA